MGHSVYTWLQVQYVPLTLWELWARNMFSFVRQKIITYITDKKFSEILQGSIWALSANVFATGFGLVTTVIIARTYGADMLGIVAILQSFFILTTIFTVLGTNTSILRLIPEHITKYSPTSAFKVYQKIQYFVAGLSVITGGILFSASGFISEVIFSKPHLQFYFALTAIFIVFKSLMLLNQQAVRGLRLIRAFAFMQLLPHLSKLLILLLITFFFFHQDNPVYALIGSFVATSLVGIWLMNQVFRQKSAAGDIVHPMSLKDILSISVPMLMTSTMMFIIGQTGVLILGMFRPEAQVGYYAIAVKLASLSTFVLTAINSMAAPKFSELYHSDKVDDLFYVAKKSAKLIFWTTTPILIGFIVLGKPVLQTVFGSEFAIAYPALILLALGQFVNSAAGATGYFMNMTGHQNMFRNIVFIAALTNIVLNILLIPQFGLYGAAIAAMVSIMIWNIATLHYIKKKFGKTTGYFPFLAS